MYRKENKINIIYNLFFLSLIVKILQSDIYIYIYLQHMQNYMELVMYNTYIQHEDMYKFELGIDFHRVLGKG